METAVHLATTTTQILEVSKGDVMVKQETRGKARRKVGELVEGVAKAIKK